MYDSYVFLVDDDFGWLDMVVFFFLSDWVFWGIELFKLVKEIFFGFFVMVFELFFFFFKDDFCLWGFFIMFFLVDFGLLIELGFVVFMFFGFVIFWWYFGVWWKEWFCLILDLIFVLFFKEFFFKSLGDFFILVFIVKGFFKFMVELFILCCFL